MINFNKELRDKVEDKVLMSLNSQHTRISQELLESIIDIELAKLIDILLTLTDKTLNNV